MSLQSLTTRDTVTLKRAARTSDAGGTPVDTYTTTSRGSLPTTWKCRAQPLSSKEKIAYGVSANEDVWKFLGTENPQIDVRDHIAWTDTDGTSREASVIQPSRNLDGQSRLYVALGEITGNET